MFTATETAKSEGAGFVFNSVILGGGPRYYACPMRGVSSKFRGLMRGLLGTLPFAFMNIACISSFPYSGSGGLTLSPDGKTLAYVRNNQTCVSYGNPCGGRVLGGAEYVRWHPVDSWLFRKSVRVGSYSGEPPTGRIEGMLARIKFSPDSRHLAVLNRGVLSCIDTHTSRFWPLTPPDERVTTFSWIADGAVAYVGNPSNRTFFRHRISDPPGTRDTILENAGRALQGLYFPFEYWSPKGGFVIYKKSEGAFGFGLLNTDSGDVCTFGTPSGAAI